MTVLGRWLAGNEGAYFLQESRSAAGRLAAAAKKKKKMKEEAAQNKGEGELNSPPPSVPGAVGEEEPLAAEASADVLPEILRHSIPIRYQEEMSPSSFSGGSKWALGSDPARSPPVDVVINPVRDYISLPQITLGPRRWQLPDVQSSVSASTANELRRRRHSQPVDSENLPAAAAAAAAGYHREFAIVTAIAFGGATSIFALTASRLEIHNTNDIRTKGRDLIQPRAELVREQMAPLRTWSENMSKKWQYRREKQAKEHPVVQQLSKILGRDL